MPSKVEISNTINAIKNVKHYTIILTLLSTGVRISELLNLRLKDIEADNNRILIRDGKGSKSRFFSLNKHLLNKLRLYYELYKPKCYLFEGTSGRYSKSSTNKMIKKHFGNNCHAHIFRHLYMINEDVNIHRLKNMTGHKNENTLNWYYQYTEMSRENNINPLNELTFY